MLSAEKVTALKGFLSRLPQSAASRLALAVEADRRAGGNGLPHDVILDALRPTLVNIGDEAVKSSEQMFGELELHTLAIRNARPADFNEQDLIANLAAFAKLSGALLREHGTNSGDKNAQRLAKHRAAVTDIMNGFMERAPRVILAALPIRKFGAFGFTNPKRIDLSRAADEGKVEHARSFAQLLVHCRPLAVPLGFDAEFRPALDETISALRRYGEDIAREVRASTSESRDFAEAHLGVALELFTIVLGKQEADLLRRNAYSG
jgi:hypothetical protein